MIDDCWYWAGHIRPDGYGALYVKQDNGKYLNLKAHREVYRALKGDFADNLVCDHLCRNKACINPEHIEPVANRVNISRGNAGRFNALKTHCPHGHEYTEQNTIVKILRKKRIGRACRTCDNNYQRRYRKQRLTA